MRGISSTRRRVMACTCGHSVACEAGFVAVSILFLITIGRFTAVASQLPLAILMTAGFILLGFAIKSPAVPEHPLGTPASPKLLAGFFLASTLVVFFFAPIWLTPATPHPLQPALSVLVAIGVVTLMFGFLHARPLSPRQLFAVVCGIATAMFLISVFGPQLALGAPIGVVVYLIVLAFSWRRMRLSDSPISTA